MLAAALAMIRDDSDKELVRELFKTHEQMMYKIALNILHSRTDAEDAVQNTVLKIIDNMEKLRNINGSETKFYIITMTRNTALDMLRKNKAMPESGSPEELAEISSEVCVEREAIARIELEAVKKALLSLAEDEYEVLFLNLISGLEPQEIAKKLGISSNAARQRIFRAKQKLKKILKKEGYIDGV